MRASSSQLSDVLSGSHSSYLLVDVLHGTDRVAQGVRPVSWSLSGDLGRDPKYTGSLRFVHESVSGESWVPDGVDGVLSPFRATLILTQVTVAGGFEERTQLGLFDVVAVPFAEDTVSHVNARWVEESDEVGDVFPVPDLFPGDDEWPGDVEYDFGGLAGGLQRVVTSTVDVDVESLDGRVLGDSFLSPVTVQGAAVDVWRRFGGLPVAAEGAGSLPRMTFPAERGSRLDLVQECARVMGGVAVVDWRGAWALSGSSLIVLEAWGDQSTVVDVSASVDLDGFFNVVVGDFESAEGRPIRSVWEAPGRLSPAELGRQWVTYFSSDSVRSQFEADAAVRAVGEAAIAQELDVPLSCVANPLVEVGDRVRVDGWLRPLEGVVQRVELSDSAVMGVTVRVRRVP